MAPRTVRVFVTVGCLLGVGVGLGVAMAGGTSDAPVSTPVVTPSNAASPAKSAHIQETRFELRAATTPGLECLSVTNAVFSEYEGNTWIACTDAPNIAKHGFVQTYRVNDAPVTLFGIAPTGTSQIRLDGKDVAAQAQGFFIVEGLSPEGAKTVTFTTPSGTQTLRFPAAPSPSAFPDDGVTP